MNAAATPEEFAVEVALEPRFRAGRGNRSRRNFDRSWLILCARAEGQTYAKIAKAHGICAERVHEIWHADSA